MLHSLLLLLSSSFLLPAGEKDVLWGTEWGERSCHDYGICNRERYRGRRRAGQARVGRQQWAVTSSGSCSSQSIYGNHINSRGYKILLLARSITGKTATTVTQPPPHLILEDGADLACIIDAWPEEG